MSEWAEVIDPEELARIEPSTQRELLLHAVSERRSPDRRSVFTNRTLRMEKIRYVGFDLDWTLADYYRNELSELAFKLTLERLIESRGYPSVILDAEFRPDFCHRGVILDTEAGTVLKMSRHRYVGRAYQGRRFLDTEERSRLYRRKPINLNHKRYHRVDTLFELPEVNIFAELIEIANQRPQALRLDSFERLYLDTRAAIDSVHADGTLKRQVLADRERYLPADPRMALALKRMAMSNRRLLLITNSEWYYTAGLCEYMFADALPGLRSWRELFDLVIVDAAKPSFFRKGQAFVELDAAGQPAGEVDVPRWGGVYSGGSRERLMDLLDGPGEAVLYVGDHIYGDILSSKLASTWRTALIVRELEHELAVRRDLSLELRHLEVLRSELASSGRRMDDLHDVLELYRDLVPSLNDQGSADGSSPAPARDAGLLQIQGRLGELRNEHRAMRHHARRLQGRISAAINPFWGSLFKQGSNKSLFGSQIDDFACIYTARVSNFADYGSDHYFRVQTDSMMHEASI